MRNYEKQEATFSRKPVIIECIPNVSTSSELVVSNIQKAIKQVDGCQLLHTDTGVAANRTVFTYAGSPLAVYKATQLLYEIADYEIDMRQHKGVHPRIGAVDVCPFVPLQGISIEDCVKLCDQLAQWVWDKLKIPVYCYHYAARTQDRFSLANIRKGNYEALSEKIKLPHWKPDFGEAVFNPTFGATTMGVRDLMLAYNINLKHASIGQANKIAGQVRETGIASAQTGTKQAGIFKGVKAMGWYLKDLDLVQVTTNIMDIKSVSAIALFNKIKELAVAENIQVAGSELIGMAPLMALEIKNNAATIDKDVAHVVNYLGLNQLSPFKPFERIIELALGLANSSKENAWRLTKPGLLLLLNIFSSASAPW
ncbi:MAG: glutamate formimidoyltransferase [Bacteroidales bacterium]|nr:glutamate formimidoyltransferase [Bacteroidales bacterium]